MTILFLRQPAIWSGHTCRLFTALTRASAPDNRHARGVVRQTIAIFRFDPCTQMRAWTADRTLARLAVALMPTSEAQSVKVGKIDRFSAQDRVKTDILPRRVANLGPK